MCCIGKALTDCSLLACLGNERLPIQPRGAVGFTYFDASAFSSAGLSENMASNWACCSAVKGCGLKIIVCIIFSRFGVEESTMT